MEAYATYLMIVTGSLLDILAKRLANLGHETNTELLKIDTQTFDILETSFRVDCVQVYAKISRLDHTLVHPEKTTTKTFNFIATAQ